VNLPIEPPLEPMLAKASDNLPEGDATWWRWYVGRVQKAADAHR